ncbi:HK97 family phage prohead protease [Methylibium sp.]|uniref:phage major capsid protein n=1 Tax=Methylibium sp. TaxID=2067992 RepID=UPI0017FE019D|nr:HK97 family phage prohead protease [Methylibium sp.]MBA3589958.1 HK97 family phage prohead protease [Methylibium sp.]
MTDPVFYRFREFDEAPRAEEDGKIRLLASTDEPVDWGGWREVLVHGEGAIDTSAARALLLNHKADMIAGTISDIRAEGGELSSNAIIDPDARMPSGVNVRRAVASGALRGVSVGYVYRNEDVTWDEATRTATVRKWRLLEISLTPIPADGRAHVRSLPDGIIPVQPPTAPAVRTTEVRVSEAAPINPQGIAPSDIINHADISEKARAGAIAETREITALAESVGLRASDYIGKSKVDAQALMLTEMAKRNATPPPAVGIAAPGRVDYDQADKARDAFAAAFAGRANVRSAEFAAGQAGNPLMGRSLLDMVSRTAQMLGLRTGEWERKDLAYFLMGKQELMGNRAQRDATNVTLASFPNFVFLNAITKIVARGFEQGSAVARYKRICETQRVPDFKQFTIGSLGTGNLIKTAESVAFPELDKAEGAYNSTVKMWGGTLSLSMQAMISDDTAQFERILRQAGAIADKTIDKRVFQKLLMGTSAAEATSTWTNNTSSGGSLVYTTADLASAARGKLGIVRAAMANKVGQDGNPLGTLPRFLVVPVTREVEAQGIVGASGPALQAGVAQSAMSMEVISSPWLEASALVGYSTTSYYLLADPLEVTGLVLSLINGFDSVQVNPYDVGSAAGLAWKLWLPFEADLVAQANSAGTTIIAAAQQGTT